MSNFEKPSERGNIVDLAAVRRMKERDESPFAHLHVMPEKPDLHAMYDNAKGVMEMYQDTGKLFADFTEEYTARSLEKPTQEELTVEFERSLRVQTSFAQVYSTEDLAGVFQFHTGNSDHYGKILLYCYAEELVRRLDLRSESSSVGV